MDALSRAQCHNLDLLRIWMVSEEVALVHVGMQCEYRGTITDSTGARGGEELWRMMNAERLRIGFTSQVRKSQHRLYL